jgi:sterol desaturase/sphingolipid hydroxylase (fatty acid hydroxylase superfamily)
MFGEWIIPNLLEISIIFLMVCIARIPERTWPIAITPLSEVIDDWKVVSANLALTSLLAPLTTVCSGIILSTLGHGWIHLPTHGYWYPVSLIILVVISDLYYYIFHRLEHAIPFLWAMHSLHHSANAVTFVTGARHLWIERVMASAVLPIMPLLFQIPPDMQFILSLIFFFSDICAHLNVRFPMGRMITLVNSPQWHRIHHSAMPEHRDKNFCYLLPLWDILFGTAWIPKPDEYPVTGLDPPVRVSVIDSIIWQFRHVRWPATANRCAPSVAEIVEVHELLRADVLENAAVPRLARLRTTRPQSPLGRAPTSPVRSS